MRPISTNFQQCYKKPFSQFKLKRHNHRHETIFLYYNLNSNDEGRHALFHEDVKIRESYFIKLYQRMALALLYTATTKHSMLSIPYRYNKNLNIFIQSKISTNSVLLQTLQSTGKKDSLHHFYYIHVIPFIYLCTIILYHQTTTITTKKLQRYHSISSSL